MTYHAAALLDDAWDLYLKIASSEDRLICTQSPEWVLPKTPYDFAALLCKSLIPLTYNFNDKHNKGATEEIWGAMVDQGEVIAITYANEILNRADHF